MASPPLLPSWGQKGLWSLRRPEEWQAPAYIGPCIPGHFRDGQEGEAGGQETGEQAGLRVQGARRRLELAGGNEDEEEETGGLWGSGRQEGHHVGRFLESHVLRSP